MIHGSIMGFSMGFSFPERASNGLTSSTSSRHEAMGALLIWSSKLGVDPKLRRVDPWDW